MSFVRDVKDQEKALIEITKYYAMCVILRILSVSIDKVKLIMS